jgi:hypothetical protein
MATIKQWYQKIIDEKQKFSSLDALLPLPETTEAFTNDLKTQSAVAIWRLSAWIFAAQAFNLEQLWATKAIELQTIQDETPPHTRIWWNKFIKAFQNGDTTIVDENGKVTYETIDDTKKIVELVTVENVDGAWTFNPATSTVPSVNIYPAKTNGVDVFGNVVYTKLSNAETDSLRAYVNEGKPLGIKTSVIQDVGTIQVLLSLYYDPKILNYGGVLISDPSRNIMLEQLYKFMSEDVNPKGVINKNRFKAYLTNGEGIEDVDVVALNWSATSDGIYVAVGRNLEINGVAIQYDFNGLEPNWYPESYI